MGYSKDERANTFCTRIEEPQRSFATAMRSVGPAQRQLILLASRVKLKRAAIFLFVRRTRPACNAMRSIAGRQKWRAAGCEKFPLGNLFATYYITVQNTLLNFL